MTDRRYYDQPVIYNEPRWKSYVAKTNMPVFTIEQCNKIIQTGRSLPPNKATIGIEQNKLDTGIRSSHVSFIPFPLLEPMYRRLEEVVRQINENHFGFEDIRLSEYAQYTEYENGGYYNWHIDSSIDGRGEPPVRKISMSLLLNNENEFEGGELEIVQPDNKVFIKQGQAVFFASFLNHRVVPITNGTRKSLVVWFGGRPFR